MQNTVLMALPAFPAVALGGVSSKHLLTLMRAFMGMFAILQAAPAASAEPVGKPATREEIRQANSRLPAMFSGQTDLPDDPIAAVSLEKKIYWSSQASGRLLLLPASVRYRGMANAYCRLLTASADFKEMRLVALPAQVNFDDCSGVSDLRYVDVNGDGLLDVVEGVRVKSNISSAAVTVPLVYLSTSAQGSGYCYSDAASRQLNPADLKSEDSVRKALEAARWRLGVLQFDCAPE